MTERTFNVIILGDNTLVIEGLIRVLNAYDFTIIASGSLSTDIRAPSEMPRDSGVLLIIDASHNFEVAISPIAEFKRSHPNGRVAVLVDQHHFNTSKMISAFHNGANAYLLNSIRIETLLKSFELVILGEMIVPHVLLADLLNRSWHRSARSKDDQKNASDHIDREHEEAGWPEQDDDAIRIASSSNERYCSPDLSPRQTAILRCLIEGDSNKVIARKMKIADATVKVHVKTILRKIRVVNRTQAAIWAMRNDPFILTNYDDRSKASKLRGSESSRSLVTAPP